MINLNDINDYFEEEAAMNGVVVPNRFAPDEDIQMSAIVQNIVEVCVVPMVEGCATYFNGKIAELEAKLEALTSIMVNK